MNDNSKEAFNNIKPRLGLIQEQIMSHLPKFPMGVTCHVLAIACGLTEEQCRKRMSELERVGMAMRSDKKFTYKGSDGRTYHKSLWMPVNNEI